MVPLGAAYVTGVPINPVTEAVWTASAWISATTTILSLVQAANPGAVVVPNGLSSAGEYFSKTASTAPLLGPTGAAIAEIWLRSAGAPAAAFPSASRWIEDVAMLGTAEAAGESILTTTKLFTVMT